MTINCVDTVAYQVNSPYPSMMFFLVFLCNFMCLILDTVPGGKKIVPGFLFIKELTPLNSNVS